jgi:hypothetical protein
MTPRHRSAFLVLATILLVHAGGMAFGGGGRIEAFVGSAVCGLGAAICAQRAVRRPERRGHEDAAPRRGAE